LNLQNQDELRLSNAVKLDTIEAMSREEAKCATKVYATTTEEYEDAQINPFQQNNWWGAFSSKLLFIETAFHRIPIGVAFHQTYIKCTHSLNEYTHNSPIFDERPPSGYSPNALEGSFSSNLQKVCPFTKPTIK
jgi:hypothetical protein